MKVFWMRIKASEFRGYTIHILHERDRMPFPIERAAYEVDKDADVVETDKIMAMIKWEGIHPFFRKHVERNIVEALELKEAYKRRLHLESDEGAY